MIKLVRVERDSQEVHRLNKSTPLCQIQVPLDGKIIRVWIFMVHRLEEEAYHSLTWAWPLWPFLFLAIPSCDDGQTVQIPLQ